MDPIVIPGLPAHLRVMPPEIDGPDDPLRAEKVAGWLDWGMQVFAYRQERWAICEGLVEGYNVQKEIERELFICSQSPLYLSTMYLSIYETDPKRLALYPWYNPKMAGWLPAIPFWYLARMFHWLDDRLAGKNGLTNGLMPKPRRMGISDGCVNWSLAHWLTDPVFSAKFVSRKLDLVYDKDNMDALLQRAVTKLDDAPGNAPIPGWLLPPGWSADKNVSEPQISRPDNKNLMVGEATTGTAGRGGRSGAAFLDEAAVMGKTLNRIIGAVQATAPMVIIVSSETTEEGEQFVDMVRKAERENPEMVFDLRYWMHPFQDHEWLLAEEQRYIDVDNHPAFFREILRDVEAGETGWMYHDARGMVCEPNIISPLDHEHAWVEIGMDPGLRDETALHWMLIDPICGMDVMLESYEAAGLSPEYYAAIIAGMDPADLPTYRFSPLTEQTMAWARELNEAGFRPKTIYGDPAGSQSHTGTDPVTGRDTDWYARMLYFWADHGIEPIPIVFNWQRKLGRELQGRRTATMEWLRSGRPRFNPTPQVRFSLEALQKTKWDDGEKRITEIRDAVHDKYSHRRSALEYWVVNRTESVATDGGRLSEKDGKRRNLDEFTKRRPLKPEELAA